MNVSPKVSAGVGAAGASTPLSIIVVWVFSLFHINVPAEVAVAMGSLVAAVASGIGGYIVPHVEPPVPPPPAVP